MLIYLVRDLKDFEVYGEFDNIEDAQEFIDNDQNDHNLEIEAFYDEEEEEEG